MPKKIIKEYEVYTYEELDASAKQYAKDAITMIIQENRCESLFGDLVEYAERKYGLYLDEDTLNYSLTYSQGDGVSFTSGSLVDYKNVYDYEYGTLNDLNEFERRVVEKLTKEELDLLLEYLSSGYNVISSIRLSHQYTHLHTCDIDADYYINEEDSIKEQEINTFIRNLCETLIWPTYEEICLDLEKVGYDLLDVTDDDVSGYVNDFEVVFFENGKIADLN